MAKRANLVALALLWVAHGGPASAEGLVGVYRLTGVMEIAAGLELQANGRFRFGMSYGALDEEAEGKWRREGDRILLNTDPRPLPPEWKLLSQEPGTPGQFELLLVNAEGRAIPNIEVKATLSDGRVETARTGAEWMQVDTIPVSLRFHIPVYDVESPEIPVDVAKGTRVRVQLLPNGLGVRDFRDWPLEIKGGSLVPPDAPGDQGFRKVGETD